MLQTLDLAVVQKLHNPSQRFKNQKKAVVVGLHGIWAVCFHGIPILKFRSRRQLNFKIGHLKCNASKLKTRLSLRYILLPLTRRLRRIVEKWPLKLDLGQIQMKCCDFRWTKLLVRSLVNAKKLHQVVNRNSRLPITSSRRLPNNQDQVNYYRQWLRTRTQSQFC